MAETPLLSICPILHQRGSSWARLFLNLQFAAVRSLCPKMSRWCRRDGETRLAADSEPWGLLCHWHPSAVWQPVQSIRICQMMTMLPIRPMCLLAPRKLFSAVALSLQLWRLAASGHRFDTGLCSGSPLESLACRICSVCRFFKLYKWDVPGLKEEKSKLDGPARIKWNLQWALTESAKNRGWKLISVAQRAKGNSGSKWRVGEHRQR